MIDVDRLLIFYLIASIDPLNVLPLKWLTVSINQVCEACSIINRDI